MSRPHQAVSSRTRVGLRHSAVPFVRAITSVTALCTVVGLIGFVYSTTLSSTKEPRLVDDPTGKRLFICFDAFMWLWIAGPMFVSHVRVKYRALYKYSPMRLSTALGALSILIGHGTWIMYPFWDNMAVATNFVAFLLINVCPLIVGKWLVYRESKLPSGSRAIPNQQKQSTLMFPGIVIALTSYGVSLPMENLAVQGMLLLLVLGTGAIVCITALKYRFHLKLHFDYVLMLWCAYHVAPVARRAILGISETDFGKSNPIILIYGYRGLLSMFVIMFDDLMEATFGVWPKSLWGTYFMRLIESLVSLTMALENIKTQAAVVTYVGTNVFITVLKDSGLQDDIRYLLMNGYCVWAPVRRYFPGSSQQPRPALESMHSLPPALVAPDSTAISSDPASVPVHGTESPAPASVGPGSSSAIPSLVSWWWPPKVIKHTTQEQVRALSVDVGIQIERSELTLMSRVSAFACVGACYCVAQVWQRTSKTRLEMLKQNGEAQRAALLLFGLSLAELVVSRAIAVYIMNRKIRRFSKLMRVTGVTTASLAQARPAPTPAQGGPTTKAAALTSGAALRPAVLVQSSSLSSGLTAESASLASMRHLVPGEGASPHHHDNDSGLPLHAMWTTGLPQQRSYQQLVFALVTFTSLVHFGAW